MSARETGGIGRWINELEESLIAIILGLMTLITFANVIARYVFNSNLLWALELTVFLFAWLVLLGMSYAVKTVAHLGVDVVANMAAPPLRKAMTLVAVAACIVYSLLLLKGGWDYWYKFASTAAFLEVDDIPMPDFLQFFAAWLNDGEPYEKVPRFIPYLVLPLGLALLLFRFLQIGWAVLNDRQELIIASHEAEDMVEQVGGNPELADSPAEKQEGTR
ncbi:TRAP transporter small permease [Granulosicoccaceae sp. 1_MG-2023]|nr:TRAP transporter small permease [Granulosicoccaceae sp. 1_MG-2023]